MIAMITLVQSVLNLQKIEFYFLENVLHIYIEQVLYF